MSFSPVRTVSPHVSLFVNDIALPAAEAQQDQIEDPADDPGDAGVAGGLPHCSH